MRPILPIYLISLLVFILALAASFQCRWSAFFSPRSFAGRNLKSGEIEYQKQHQVQPVQLADSLAPSGGAFEFSNLLKMFLSSPVASSQDNLIDSTLLSPDAALNESSRPRSLSDPNVFSSARHPSGSYSMNYSMSPIIDFSHSIINRINHLTQKTLSSKSPTVKDYQAELVSNSKAKTATVDVSPAKNPVILIPGYGGTRLEARLNKKSVVRYMCRMESDWHDIWINVRLLLPLMIDCLIDNFRLEYDYATNTTKNADGVEIRVKNDSQSLSVIEHLHDLPIPGLAYFGPMVYRLIHKLNYVRNDNIRGAPYDFRKAPNELQDFFRNLKSNSEDLYVTNGERPVTFICHSMGCNNMLYFLRNRSQKWKDKYVKRLISLAAAWGGSLSALRATALGDDLGLPYLLDESKLVSVQRSLPSTIFLLPHKDAYAGVPLIRSNVKNPSSYSNQKARSQYNSTLPEKRYMADDYESFFRDINHPDGYRMWLDTRDLLGSLEAPGVEVWCLIGRGQPTLSRLEYSGEFPRSTIEEIYDDGDGTISMQSSNICRRWMNEQKQNVMFREFQMGHLQILRNEQVLDFIETIVNQK